MGVFSANAQLPQLVDEGLAKTSLVYEKLHRLEDFAHADLCRLNKMKPENGLVSFLRGLLKSTKSMLQQVAPSLSHPPKLWYKC